MSEPLGFIGKVLLIMGFVFTVTGIILLLTDKIPFLGKLPGDIYIKKGNFTFYFPLVTSIVISIILTIIFWIIGRLTH